MGTITATDSPLFEMLADAGGCPGEYSTGDDYEEGDKVAKDNFLYQCKSWPASAHYSQAGYEPGTSIDGGTKKLEY